MKFICILIIACIITDFSFCNLRREQEGNLTKLARKLDVKVTKDKSANFPFESKSKKERKMYLNNGNTGNTGNNVNNANNNNNQNSNSNSNNGLSNISGPPKSLYGDVTELGSKYEPNKYPKCLVEKTENTKETQNKLKICTLNHAFKSIDLNEQIFNTCISKYNETYNKKGPNKGVSYLLSDLINFASKGNQERLLKKISICGDQFVNEFMSKYQQYQANFKIGLSLFVDLNNPQQSPPNAPEGLKFE